MTVNPALKRYPTETIPCLRHGRMPDRPVPTLFWEGSGIEFTANAGEVWVEFESDWTDYEEIVRITVDGADLIRRMLDPGICRVCVFRNLSKKPRIVRVYKEVQPMDDRDRFLTVPAVLCDGSFESISPRPLRYEFIGDSLTSGEGLIGAQCELDWRATVFGTRGNYGLAVGEAMGADVRLYALSGWGIACDCKNNPNKAMHLYYDRVCGMMHSQKAIECGAQETFSPEDWKADLVAINLGANDLGAFGREPWKDPVTGELWQMRLDEAGKPDPRDVDRLYRRIVECLRTVRRHNPDSQILWIFGMLCARQELDDLVHAAMREVNDPNLDFLRVPTCLPEQKGARNHPGPASHRAVADTVINYLKAGKQNA